MFFFFGWLPCHPSDMTLVEALQRFYNHICVRDLWLFVYPWKLCKPDMVSVFVEETCLVCVWAITTLGDSFSSGGGCDLASITRCRLTWGKFNELLAILISHLFLSHRKEEFTIHMSGAPCTIIPGPNPMRSASPATQWPGYDPRDVSQLATSPGEDAGQRPAACSQV